MREIIHYLKACLKVYVATLGLSIIFVPVFLMLVTDNPMELGNPETMGIPAQYFSLVMRLLVYGILFSWIGLIAVAFMDLFIRAFKWNTSVRRTIGCALLVGIVTFPISYFSDQDQPSVYMVLTICYTGLGASLGFFHYRIIGPVD